MALTIRIRNESTVVVVVPITKSFSKTFRANCNREKKNFMITEHTYIPKAHDELRISSRTQNTEETTKIQKRYRTKYLAEPVNEAIQLCHKFQKHLQIS